MCAKMTFLNKLELKIEVRTPIFSSAVVDTTFVDIYVDTEDIPTCRYNIQHIDKRTMEK